MSNNSAKGRFSIESPPAGSSGGRLWWWALGFLAVAAGLLFVMALAWALLNGSGGSLELSSPAWLQDTAFAAVLATATPTPTPTPTMAPAQVAAQFVPQLQAALSSANWDRALEIIAIMQGVDLSGENVRQWALATHMQYGQALVQSGQEASALLQFDRAVDLAHDDAEARLWQQTTQQYLAGREAFELGQWDAAIQSFTRAYENKPDYSDLHSHLVNSYQRKGQAAIEEAAWSTAIESLGQALDRAGDNALKRAEVAELLSEAYQGQGKAALSEEKWTAAIKTMSEAQARLPNDAEITSLLATAYRQRGIANQDNQKLQEAKADLNASLSLRPNNAEAKAHLDRVLYLLSKRIEIDISEQRLYAWSGDKLVYKFPVSTGLKGRDTATGHYQILDKIPMAYSRIWKLKMPFWMGIYYVQGIENGIHALPIRPDGSVMWGGLLGQRASYGCIILSNQAAKKLYNWADIGTQVHIHR